MRRKLLLVAAAVALAPLVAGAYVSPGKPQGLVSDFANVLPSADRQSLESTLTALKQSTGSEVAVVTVSTVGRDETIETYAVKLFEEWGIGKQGKDNGVLVLVGVGDRQVRIEVGYGLEGALTDAQSSWIIREEMLPAFREGNYAGGLSRAVGTIAEAIRGETVPSDAPPASGQGRPNINWFWLIFFLPMWLASILGRSKSWWAGGVLGGIAGVILGFVHGFLYTGLIAIAALVPIGLLFDFLVSRAYAKRGPGGGPPWFIGGPWIGGGFGGGGFGGGGFGGFSGGSSGGGGSSGRW